MRIANATDKVKRHLGIALVPQAGLAVSLVILIQDDPAFSGVAEIFSSVVLTVVTVNEIVGPLCTRYALAKSGELGKDRHRLMDFLEEENIVTDFEAGTKDEAIEKLVDMMISSQRLKGVERQALLDSVRDRERQASTCLGGGLAVPHGILTEGKPMMGVMALSRSGFRSRHPTADPCTAWSCSARPPTNATDTCRCSPRWRATSAPTPSSRPSSSTPRAPPTPASSCTARSPRTSTTT